MGVLRPLIVLSAVGLSVVAAFACASFTGEGESIADGGADAAEAGPSRFVWARSFGGPDRANGGGSGASCRLSVEPGGAMALAGAAWGDSIDLGQGARPTKGGGDVFDLRLDNQGKTLFGNLYGDNLEQSGASVLSSAQYVYFTSTFRGGVALPPTQSVTGDAIAWNSFAARAQGSTGDVITVHQIKGPLSFLKSVAAYPGEGVFAFGDWKTSVSLDLLPPVTPKPPATSASGARLFLARLFTTSTAADGLFTFEPDGATDDVIADGVASTPDGDILMTGRYHGTVAFPGAKALISPNGDAYVARLDPTMKARFALGFGGTGEDEGRAAAFIPGSDDFVVAGTFSGTVTTAAAGMVASRGAFDVFVLRVNRSGDIVWLRTFGGAADDDAAAIVATADRIYVAGGFKSPTMEAGGTTLTNADPRGLGTSDGYLVELAARDGAPIDALRVGGAGADVATGVGVTTAGTVVVSGTFEGDMDLGTLHLKSSGRSDCFVTQLSR